MNTNTHKKFSASGAHRYLHCLGSINACANAPKGKSSKFADEGTKAHAVAEAILKGEAYVADAGMVANVKFYTDYVLERSKGKELLVEQKFSLDFIHPDLGGTNDACIRDAFRDLEIIDLKYGAGVPVEVEDNPQLLIYALGALWNDDLKALDNEFETITTTIIQPRCPHPDGVIRSKTYSFHEVVEFSKTLKAAIEAAEKPDAPLASGDWCRWCPASPICPLLHAQTMEIVSKDFDAIPDVTVLSEEQVVKAFKAKKVIENFLESCEQMLFDSMTAGKVYEGLQLGRGRGSRKWAVDDETVSARLLAKGFSIEDIQEVSLKSIAKLEKLKKEIPEELIQKVEGALKVEVITEKTTKKKVKELTTDF